MGGWAAHSPPGPPTQLRLGRAPHTAAWYRLSPCSQGGGGRQDPTPRKERQAWRQETNAPRPTQVPGRLTAKLTGGRKAGPQALQFGAGHPGGLRGPPRVLAMHSNREGRGSRQAAGTHWCGGERGDRRQGSYRPEETPGRRGGAQTGAPRREDEQQPLAQGPRA